MAVAMILFVDKFIKSGSVPIHLITCKDGKGRDCHYFLMCSHQKLQMLLSEKEGILKLEDYGQVIASGFGHKPQAETKKMLKEKYDYDADALV